MNLLSTLPLNKPMRYEEFTEKLSFLASHSDTTGEKTLAHIEATKINAQRVKRLDKTCEINRELVNTIQAFKTPCTWLVLVESWCGDGAQCLPVIAKIASLSTKIELKILLRDENPELMNCYLTNGTRSIPKLICIDNQTQLEMGTWGPRPAAIQQIASNFKTNHPTAAHSEFVNHLHLSYARDKTNAIQNEFKTLLKEWEMVKI